jgi:hypothetical protein
MTKAALLIGGILSYLLGVYLSPHLVSVTILHELAAPLASSKSSTTQQHDDNEKPIELPPLPPSFSPGDTAENDNRAANDINNAADKAYASLVNMNNQDPFKDIQLVLHRNGEADPCSVQKASVSASTSFIESIKAFGSKPLEKYTKYDFDALLTHALGVGLTSKVGEGVKPSTLLDDSGEKCGPTWKEENHYLDAIATTSIHHVGHQEYSDKYLISPLLKYCDMGQSRTTIQLDHGKLVRMPTIQSLPCHFHTREGLRITSLKMLADLAAEKAGEAQECANPQDGQDASSCASNITSKELHIYAVPAGRVFIFAPKYIGEIFNLSHITSHDNLPISLRVLSLSPRVFDIYNFFSRDESARIVDKALKETSETHRMKRSSTGASGYNVNSRRTSENGFDTHGKEAQVVKRRCMNVLGFDEYEEGLTDGLQVLRYNKTTAYVPHLDWIDDYQKKEEHDYDSEHLGSNRFATILLYMSDLEEGDGGETVFTNGWPAEVNEEDRVDYNTALSQLRESGDVKHLLKEGSWEEEMVAKCRSRLSVRPHSSRAVLFYSQEPDGKPDQNSMHGGCPVISGEKWAGK